MPLPSREHVLLSFSTTTTLLNLPLPQVPKEHRRPTRQTWSALYPAYDPVSGRHRVLADCRSLTAIGQHAIDLTGTDLRCPGLVGGQALPSE